jgi:hypothetical protein
VIIIIGSFFKVQFWVGKFQWPGLKNAKANLAFARFAFVGSPVRIRMEVSDAQTQVFAISTHFEDN